MASSTQSLQKLMKAQFLDDFKKPYELRSVLLSSLTSLHDLLIKVDAANYCPQMLSWQMVSYYQILLHSHMLAAMNLQSQWVSPTEASNTYRFKIGDRIGVPCRGFHPCESCFECLSYSSPESDPPGVSEYAVVDERQVALIPECMDAVEVALLMYAGVTIYAAIEICNLQQGRRLGIIGCGGGLGHLGLQFATKMGLQTYGMDNSDAALQLSHGLKTVATIVELRVEGGDEIVREIGMEDGKTVRGEMGLGAVIV